MIFHDFKDLTMIYSSDKNGKPDYTWDKAKIVVWNSDEQKEMNIVFVGSERPDEKQPGKIHFNVFYKNKDSNPLKDAFNNFLQKTFPNIDNDTKKEYEKIYLQELINVRNEEN